MVGARLDAPVLALTGSARVYSGADGAELYVFAGDDFFDEFGTSVSGAGDVDADGVADVVVGAPFALGTGKVRVFSGATGAVVREWSGANFFDQFGFAVSDAGDANDDGHADVVVGAPLANGLGTAGVYSGLDGNLLPMLSGSGPADGCGQAVSGAGDVDGDGFADQVVGAPFEDGVAIDTGTVRVFAGCDGLAEGFGDGCPGASGTVPSLTVEGCPEQANRVLMTVAGGIPGEFGVVLFGAGPAEIPMENGCFLRVSPLLKPVLVFVLDAAGETTFDEVIDPDHGSGTFAAQAFVSDPLTTQGFANTNAMDFTID
ncbi:MAG: integrin alpha [Planctomycetota bacterium JB042]